jgi:hypothetical protein
MLGLVLDGRLQLDHPTIVDPSADAPVRRRAIDMSSAHDEPPALDPSTIPPLDDDDRRDAA